MLVGYSTTLTTTLFSTTVRIAVQVTTHVTVRRNQSEDTLDWSDAAITPIVVRRDHNIHKKKKTEVTREWSVARTPAGRLVGFKKGLLSAPVNSPI